MSSGVVRIGDRVALKRAALGLGCRELARQAGVSAASVSRLERGGKDVAFSTVAKLAPALGVSLDWLANGCEQHEWLTRCENCGVLA